MPSAARTVRTSPSHGQKGNTEVCTCVCERISDDTNINNDGKQLLDLCSVSGLCILNGLQRLNERQFHFPGRDGLTFKSLGDNGQSVVDYVCVNARLLESVTNLTVRTDAIEPGLSDHTPLTCYIKTTTHNDTPVTLLPTMTPPRKIKWTPQVCELVCATLPNDPQYIAIDDFFSQAFDTPAAVPHDQLQDMYTQLVTALWSVQQAKNDNATPDCAETNINLPYAATITQTRRR